MGRTTGPAAHVPGLFDKCPGLDFVLGNPPYVRLESIPETQNTAYRQLFPTMRGRADLYVGFYEAALRQLRPGGVCAFTCADRWMLNQYGETLRRYVGTGFAVETVLELHQADAFDDAVSAYPAITVIRRAAQGPAVVATATAAISQVPTVDIVRGLTAPDGPALPGLTARRLPRWFAPGEPWTRPSAARAALLAHLESHFSSLESVVTGTRVGLGVATGAVFFTDDPKAVEPAHQLRLVRPADVRTGRLTWGGQWLISPWYQGHLADLTTTPRLAAHLTSHRARLEARHVAQKNPPPGTVPSTKWTGNCTCAPSSTFPTLKTRSSQCSIPTARTPTTTCTLSFPMGGTSKYWTVCC